jgi:acyl carrier protein
MIHFEQSLIEILAELTGAEAQQISLTDNLAEQGVDSFIALRMVRAIHDRTGVEIELELLYDYPTVRQLAQYVETQINSANGNAAQVDLGNPVPTNK